MIIGSIIYSLKYKLQNKISVICGNSSVGRAIPCQGIGRRFEPGFPLHGPDRTSALRETIIGFSIRNKVDKI